MFEELTTMTLIQRIQQSQMNRDKQESERLWRQFVDRYSPRMYRWARECGLDRDDANDITYKVFARLVGERGLIHQFDREAAEHGAKPWLRRITRCVIIDWIRSEERRRERETEVMLARMEDLDRDLESELRQEREELETRRIRLRVMLDQWTGQKVKVTVFLQKLQGKAMADIARELNLTEKTAYRYDAQVKQWLEKQCGGDHEQ